MGMTNVSIPFGYVALLPLPKPVLSEVLSRNNSGFPGRNHTGLGYFMSFRAPAGSSPLSGGQPRRLEQDPNTNIITIIVFVVTNS